jgi:hypothetical protein
MSDEISLVTTPAPETTMPPSGKHKNQRKSHPVSRFRRQGLRNAAPSGARSTSTRSKTEPESLKPTMNQKVLSLIESLAGGAVTSYIGALAVKYGFPPEWASVLLGVGNGFAALGVNSEPVGHAARGGASVCGSQLLLLAAGPKPNAPAAPKIVAVPTPAQPAQPPRKNADLGTLPPGMLDAAFENARAQLAVSDGYPAGYDHQGSHHFHHGPVMP